MPIVERDPWRMQYFEKVPCPQRLFISTEDGDSYRLYPEYRWIYNKMMIADSQGLPNGPHGLEPEFFPVFSKPIYNMRGMGAGSRILKNEKEYQNNQRPGHMWMLLLQGEHVSSDVAVVKGEAMWWRHVVGKAIGDGMFDYWTVLGAARPEIETYCGDWLRRNMAGYTGMMNFETIGARIIEAHLRFSDQWPDLYGKGWLDALVCLYEKGEWRFADEGRRDGYSVVLFGAHNVHYRHPPRALVEELLQTPEVSSIQVTFHEDKPSRAHSMPPGGFRLAIVNCWNLETGFRLREKLALSYWSTQQLIRRRKRGAASSRAAR
jgi:hypothetical protein